MKKIIIKTKDTTTKAKIYNLAYLILTSDYRGIYFSAPIEEFCEFFQTPEIQNLIEELKEQVEGGLFKTCTSKNNNQKKGILWLNKDTKGEVLLYFYSEDLEVAIIKENNQYMVWKLTGDSSNIRTTGKTKLCYYLAIEEAEAIISEFFDIPENYDIEKSDDLMLDFLNIEVIK